MTTPSTGSDLIVFDGKYESVTPFVGVVGVVGVEDLGQSGSPCVNAGWQHPARAGGNPARRNRMR